MIDIDSEFDLETEEELDLINPFAESDAIDDEKLDKALERIFRKNKCECGAKAAGVPFHSRWCRLYKNVMGEEDDVPEL